MLVTMDVGVTLATIFVGLATVAAAIAAWKATSSADAVLSAAKDEAKAAGDLSQTTHLRLAASKHPLVVDVPRILFDSVVSSDPRQQVIVDTWSNPSAITLTVPIRNIGRGPAFLISVTVAPFDVAKDRPAENGFKGNPASRVLPSGETTYVAASVKIGDPLYLDMDLAIRARFQMSVRYIDQDAEQHRETVLDIRPEVDGSGHAVTGVSITAYDKVWESATPMASTREIHPAAEKPTLGEAIDKGAAILNQAAEIMRRRQEEFQQRHPIRPLSPSTLRLAALGRDADTQRFVAEALQKDNPDTDGAGSESD
jgi:hypothetical protein